jgi:hypothetical protein
MLLVKGDRVSFVLRDGRHADPPESYGLMHDVDGPGPQMIPRNVFLVGPFTRGRSAPKGTVSWETRKYMGAKHDVKMGNVNLPERDLRFSSEGWTFVGLVRRIYYMRNGYLRVPMKHDFREHQFIVVPVSTKLYRLGKWLRLQLPVTCRINERGIISP